MYLMPTSLSLQPRVSNEHPRYVNVTSPFPVECIDPNILPRLLDTYHRTLGVKFLFYNTLTYPLA